MNGKIFQRKKNSLILQPRDRAVLKKVYEYRFLDAGQIRSLCGFNSKKRTNDRLRKMFDNGYLSRRLFTDNLNKKVLCFIGPKAAEILASAAGRDPSEVGKKRTKASKTRDSFIGQFVAINDFRYSLEMAFRNRPSAALEAWQYKKVLFAADDRRIYPDAYLRFSHAGEVQNCFLEIDRSIESHKRFRKKMEFYLDYGLSGDFERHFNFKRFRLLIVCKTLERLKSLSKIVQGVTDKSFCWLAVKKNVSPDRILSEIWRRPNKEGDFSLIA